MYVHHQDRGILGQTANEVKKAAAQAPADVLSVGVDVGGAG